MTYRLLSRGEAVDQDADPYALVERGDGGRLMLLDLLDSAASEDEGLPVFPYTPRVSEEVRRRIMVAVWALAYEVYDDSLVADHVFDAECAKVDLSIDTPRPDLDAWFRENFDPCTGQWVWAHPEREGLFRIYLLLWHARNEGRAP
jgi:hypothetical protein